MARSKKAWIGFVALLDWLLWTPARRNDQWRPHIDGLRAISVLAVLFYHTTLLKIPGAFVGVDVFFVISGFLISRVIYDDIAKHGKFRIVSFYERRARRILPVFAVVTAATLIAGYFLYLPDAFAMLGRSAVYACGFAANVFFRFASGYFDGAANSEPLLHYWSLGVEEQFYIVFPLIVLAVSKLAPRLLGATILSIGAASFALAAIYVPIDPIPAFYLAQYRAWELLAGSVLALPGFPYSERRYLCEAIAAAGLALILVSAFAYNHLTPFPGPTAAVPVTGAMFILWACERSPTFVGALLSMKPLRHIGLWSYSIYMIHWPLIVFANVTWPHAGVAMEGMIVVATIALGGISYFVVETPFRRPKQVSSRARLFTASFASLLVLAVCGSVIAWTEGFPQRLSKPAQELLAYNRYNSTGIYRTATCFLQRTQPPESLKPECLTAGHPSALLWGDSFAAHYYAALRDRLSDVVVLQANMSACPPIVGRERNDVPHCKSFNDTVLRWALENRPDTVILSAAWPTDADALSGLDATIGTLRAAGLPVIIIGRAPSFRDTVPNILAKRVLRGDSSTIGGNDGVGTAFWSDHFLKDRYGGLAGVRYISFEDTICRESECPLVTASGVPAFWDHSHLTREGADWAVGRMFPAGLGIRAAQ